MTDVTSGPADEDPATPEPSAEATVEARADRRRKRVSHLLIAALCAVLGFAFVIQVRSTQDGDTLSAARPQDLVAVLDGLQRREDDLNAEIADLAESLRTLRQGGASSAEALAEAQRRASALGILAGTVPASGPGISLTIADPTDTVSPEVLLGALQELRNAGAEAIQIGPVRIGVETAFTGQAGAILIDGTAVSAPYRVLAIGDPPTMEAAMNIPGGVADTVRRAGGDLTLVQEPTVTIAALRPVREPTYARPVT